MMVGLLHRRRRAAPAPIRISSLQDEDGRRTGDLERREPKTPETGSLIFTPKTPETPALDLVLPKTPFTGNPTTTSTSSLTPETPTATTRTTLVTSIVSISTTRSSSETTHSSPTKTVFITVTPTLSTTSSSTEATAVTSIPGVIGGGIVAPDTSQGPSVAPLLESVQPQEVVNRSGAILLIVLGVLAVISLLGSLAIIFNRRANKRRNAMNQENQASMMRRSDEEPITIPAPAALDRRRTRI